MKNFVSCDVEKKVQTELLAIPVYESEPLSEAIVRLDSELDGGIRFHFEREEFVGQYLQTVQMTTNGKYSVPKLLFIGLGKREVADDVKLHEIGGALSELFGDEEVCIDFSAVDSQHAACIAFGVWLKGYRFDKYISQKKCHPNVTFLGNSNLSFHQALYQGVALARHLTAEPANMMPPQLFAEQCLALRKLGIEVEILDEKKLQKIGARALLAVGAGSRNAPCMAILKWTGASLNDPVTALVGKGVCFDSGGINIKTEHLCEMKMDKAGAASVVGTMYTLAMLKAPVNVVGIIGLAENMTDGNAFKPGDIIKTLSGISVEIVDTDNEGRLVLADCMSYVQQQFQLKQMIDLGTLTLETFGALGGEYAGLFCEDSQLRDALTASGKKSGEKLWHLPMGKEYAKYIESSVADVKNAGVFGFGESSSTAEFLKRFVQPGVSWAHVDIAGVAWVNEDHTLCPKGPTGYGVRLLTTWLLHDD